MVVEDLEKVILMYCKGKVIVMKDLEDLFLEIFDLILFVVDGEIFFDVE